ncbi:phosphatase PAP2 family protein [Salarchaeum sp. JOR-1]|uniref:phosphatase PAP2 family protein n=1 Tax=Salarchaeum sp. JOR-1 TaxID=2599399 RepID=UPI0011985356|nr:phosphatase PAP2 family protein [Salarchaeum sp. JOR-1]QDX40417.1 phosphatase PAP2 family protein [Salarchaeum sp. JOR-1]
MHGLGVSDALAGRVPEALVPLLRALTALGDPELFLVAAPLLYWLGPRYDVLSPERAARFLGIVVGGLALVVALKSLFGFHRPPATVALVHADGYGFPSGHATGAAVFYGALAALLRAGTRRTRYAVAGVVVAVVAVTRLALGVHYLPDVVAGVVAGSLHAAFALAVSRDSVANAFFVALAAGTAGLALAWTAEAATVFGATLGGIVGWQAARERVQRLADASAWSVLALVPLLAVGGLPLAIEPPVPVAAAGGIVLGFGVMWVPTRL